MDAWKKMQCTGRKFRILTFWVGFAGEDTWKPLQDLYLNAPDRVVEYLKSARNDPVAAEASETSIQTRQVDLVTNIE